MQQDCTLDFLHLNPPLKFPRDQRLKIKINALIATSN